MSHKHKHRDKHNGQQADPERDTEQSAALLNVEAVAVELKDEQATLKPPREKLDMKTYLRELNILQIELVKLQEWIKAKGLKVVVIFEGRDAAGKGGAIKTITACLNPRICRVVALGTPTEREKTQWYFQRYVPHLPAAGDNLPVPDHVGHVVQLAVRAVFYRTQDDGKILAFCHLENSLKRFGLFLFEAPYRPGILRRVSGQDRLREHQEVRSLLDGLEDPPFDPLHHIVKVADLHIHLRHRDFEAAIFWF